MGNEKTIVKFGKDTRLDTTLSVHVQIHSMYSDWKKRTIIFAFKTYFGASFPAKWIKVVWSSPFIGIKKIKK